MQHFEVLCKGCLPSYLALTIHIKILEELRTWKLSTCTATLLPWWVPWWHWEDWSVKTFRRKGWVSVQRRGWRLWQSHHSDLRVIQFSAEKPSASRGRASWTGNERGKEEALLLGEQHSPGQSWAWPTGTVSPAGTYGLAWVYCCQILQEQQPAEFEDTTSSQGSFLSWSYSCLAANNVSPAGHQQGKGIPPGGWESIPIRIHWCTS